MSQGIILGLLFGGFALLVLYKLVVIVPQQSVYVIERLGRYNRSIDAGIHLLAPFVDKIRYRHSLKEIAVDIPEQICITTDNVQVGVDGVIYMKVYDAKKASYGIHDYVFAITQLAQTTMRSEIGKLELDRTFEERTSINNQVVQELDLASDPWGVKVLRYEIKNITPPRDVLEAMEKQMRAEREKRAQVLSSEGERDAAINVAEGRKQARIKDSEAQKIMQINEAEGEAEAILSVAQATADGLKAIGEAVREPGGMDALKFKVAEQYVNQFGNVAKEGTTMILPTNLTEIGSVVATAAEVFQQKKS